MKRCPVCRSEYQIGDTCPLDGSDLLDREELATELTGSVIKGIYRLHERLGAGGANLVFRATHLESDKTVAFKVLLTTAGTAAAERFVKEGRILHALRQASIVQVQDTGYTPQGLLFYTMEYLDGEPLDRYLADRRPLAVDKVAALMAQICAGVHAAHLNHVVHRNLTPASILMVGGEPRILSFGNGEVLDRGEADDDGVASVAFAAPEVISGLGDASTASDIYSLGALFYFVLTGHAGYEGTGPGKDPSRSSSIATEFESLGYPKGFADIGEMAMAVKPEKRFSSASELAQAIDRGGLLRKQEPVIPTPIVLDEPSKPMWEEEEEEKPGWPDLFKRRDVLIGIGGVAVLLIAVLFWSILGPLLGNNDVEVAVPSVAIDAKKLAALSAPPRQGVTPRSVRIGFSGALSGPLAELGQSFSRGLEAAVRSSNQEGGVAGRRIELVTLDDKNLPELAAKNARQLLDDDQVFAAVAASGPVAVSQTAAHFAGRRFVLFGAASGSAILRQPPARPHVFNFRASLQQELRALVSYLVKGRRARIQDLAVVVQADYWHDAEAAAFRDLLGEFGHPHPESHPIVVHPDYTSRINRTFKELMRLVPEQSALIVVTSPEPAASLIARVRKQHPLLEIACVSTVGDQAFAEKLGDLAEEHAANVVVTQVVPHFLSGARVFERYRRDLKLAFPAQSIGFGSLEGYLVGRLLTEALHQAGQELNTARLVDLLENRGQIDLGFGNPCGFTPRDHQCLHRVWGTRLDVSGRAEVLDLGAQ